MKPEFDSYSDTYDAAVNASISFSGLKTDYFTRSKVQHLTGILAKHFVEPSMLDLLDVGCGIGNLHPHLAENVRTISGVDISPNSIATAHKRNPWVDYRSYDGRRLPFADAVFDVTIAICVLHHVPPPQWPEFVSELRRVVKPGGLAVVFEHNPYNILTRYAVSSCAFDKDAVLLPARKTKQLLHMAGFHSAEVHYILTIPAANQSLRKLDALLGYLPLGAQYYAVGIA